MRRSKSAGLNRPTPEVRRQKFSCRERPVSGYNGRRWTPQVATRHSLKQTCNVQGRRDARKPERTAAVQRHEPALSTRSGPSCYLTAVVQCDGHHGGRALASPCRACPGTRYFAEVIAWARTAKPRPRGRGSFCFTLPTRTDCDYGVTTSGTRVSVAVPV